MQINRETIQKELDNFISTIFLLPEIVCVKVRNIVINNGENPDTRAGKLQEIMDKSYHDCYSDVDLSVVVKISGKDTVTPAEYMKHIERFCINTDKCLGFCFIEENNMYRVIFKNGMRYDFGFEFIFDDSAKPIVLPEKKEEYSNPNWPLENINRFWFVQIQALGKLYRNDYLISSHLANMNLNETLVQQMVLRDMEYGTSHHRYGYKEEVAYWNNKNKCPIKTGDESFDIIADKLYCAAVTYDELIGAFYPDSEKRLPVFMELWECYEQNRINFS